ncbi:hypothetical protein NIES4071_20780 [Calothrix sp. NIES-4071]|nr:hypothetical protein NIES4071_20780 [Calothrix sp. NIES-4071]BAZ56410.1 hypothetical protein NIES4105_20730 [Calothrix sp. NIES-4105]
MFSASSPSLLDNEHILEIPPTSTAPEQGFSTAGACQRALINQLCLDAFLCMLREEFSVTSKIYPNHAALASIWEFVNGTAISFGSVRLILIPTLAMDGDELRVSQEWIDIPEWVGDYYLAVQVNPDEGWIRVYGYTNHQKIKTLGVYNPSDRTYSVESEDLIQDLNVLWLTTQYYPEVTRAEVTALQPLPQTQAENLLQRLGSNIKFPRLEIPFQLWGALLAHGGWRQRLYELRQGLTQQTSVIQWLTDGVSNFATQLGWSTREFLAAPSSMRSREASTVGLSRQLLVSNSIYELRVFSKGNAEELVWRFELRSSNPDNLIPSGFKLRLLTEDLQTFTNNEDTATAPVEQLYVEVMLESGEGIVWEVEPTPEDYEREILRF